MKFELITAEELIKRMGAYKFKQFHIHHTWKPEHRDFNGNNHEKLQNGMRDYHMFNNGWDDIGQHVSLYPDGFFGIGRDFDKTPCSIKGWNTGAFCIEMVGNFDMGKDTFTGVQRGSMLKVANYFGDKYGYELIKFHRDSPSSGKTCPGSGINKEEFIRDARNYNEFNNNMGSNEGESCEPVTWETDEKEVCKKQTETVRFDLFGQKAVEIPGTIIDDSVFVQARQLLEAMEFDVGWDGTSRTVLIGVKTLGRI